MTDDLTAVGTWDRYLTTEDDDSTDEAREPEDDELPAPKPEPVAVVDLGEPPF